MISESSSIQHNKIKQDTLWLTPMWQCELIIGPNQMWTPLNNYLALLEGQHDLPILKHQTLTTYPTLVNNNPMHDLYFDKDTNVISSTNKYICNLTTPPPNITLSLSNTNKMTKTPSYSTFSWSFHSMPCHYTIYTK